MKWTAELCVYITLMIPIIRQKLEEKKNDRFVASGCLNVRRQNREVADEMEHIIKILSQEVTES